NESTPSKQPWLIVDVHALEREHALLRLGASRRREAAELVASREHAVAWNDQRHRVARHRDADILRGLPLIRAGPPGELTIGDGLAELDLAQRIIDRAAERIDILEIELDRAEINPLAGEVTLGLVDHGGDRGRWLRGRALGLDVPFGRRAIRVGQAE